MLKKQKSKTNDFKYTAQHKLPKLGKIIKTWDLASLYYKDEYDENIERDITATEKLYASFVKKFKNTEFTSAIQATKEVLQAFKKLCDSKGHRPAYYFSYRLSLNANDTSAAKRLNLLEQRLTKLSNSILFFELALAKIPAEKQKQFLSDAALSEFHFFLSNVFTSAKYILSEAEERILSLKSQTSHGMWVSGTEKILGNTSIQYKGKKVPLNGALMQFMDLPKKDRHTMWKACVEALTTLGLVAENELNAVITDKKIDDELRGYKKPYSATALAYDQNEKSIETLVAVVSTKGYELSKKFYAHKAKLNGGKLTYIDREDLQQQLPTATFETAVQICRDAFHTLNSVYGEIFDTMLTSGQIDVYPKQGKGGGAYSSSGTNVPTLVLLNHSNDFQSIKTLSHEMGHAIHAYRSKTQSVLYEDHSIVTAETASTLFESIVAHNLMPALDAKQKIALLNNLICDRINTIMMCVARFSAELEIHNTIRTAGAMTWQEMSTCLTRHFEAYCGPSVTLTETDGHGIVAKMHFRMNFYQYSYAFGSLASGIMFKRYTENKAYATQIDSFLIAGRKASVDDIFKSIGINISDPKVLEEGLQILEDDIDAFIALTATQKK